MGEPRSDYLRFCHGNCGAAVMGRERLLELACPILWVWTVFSPRGSDSVHRHKNERKNGAPSVPREGSDVLFSSAPEAFARGSLVRNGSRRVSPGNRSPRVPCRWLVGTFAPSALRKNTSGEKTGDSDTETFSIPSLSSVDAPASRQRLSTRAVVADGRRPLRTKKGPGICPDPERPESLS